MFQVRTFEPWVLNRWDLNLCIHNSPLWKKVGRGLGKNEVEWLGKVDFLAAGKACAVIFWLILDRNKIAFNSSRFSVDGTLISVHAVPHCRVNGVKWMQAKHARLHFYVSVPVKLSLNMNSWAEQKKSTQAWHVCVCVCVCKCDVCVVRT